MYSFSSEKKNSHLILSFLIFGVFALSIDSIEAQVSLKPVPLKPGTYVIMESGSRVEAVASRAISDGEFRPAFVPLDGYNSQKKPRDFALDALQGFLDATVFSPSEGVSPKKKKSIPIDSCARSVTNSDASKIYYHCESGFFVADTSSPDKGFKIASATCQKILLGVMKDLDLDVKSIGQKSTATSVTKTDSVKETPPKMRPKIRRIIMGDTISK